MTTLFEISFNEEGIALTLNPILTGNPMEGGMILTQGLHDAAIESPVIAAAIRCAADFLVNHRDKVKAAVKESRVTGFTVKANGEKS